MPDAKIYCNGAWHTLPGQKVWQNGEWVTIPREGRIRFNGAWADMHIHVWNYTSSTDTCSECGATLAHVHKWSSGYCTKCETRCSHNWNYGELRDTCTICGGTKSHTHSWSSAGKCSTCGKVCIHSWNSDTGICRICGKVCNHTLSAGATCPTCGKLGKTLFQFNSLHPGYACSDDLQAAGLGSGWTAIAGTAGGVHVGIRDGQLCRIEGGEVIVMDDNTGWTAVELADGEYGSGYYGNNSFFAIRNGELYLMDTAGFPKKYGSVGGWTQLAYPYGIAGGTLYHLLNDAPGQVQGTTTGWTKISPIAGICSDKLFLFRDYASRPVQLTTYTDWIDVGSQNSAVPKGSGISHETYRYHIAAIRNNKKAYHTHYTSLNSVITDSMSEYTQATAKAVSGRYILTDSGIYDTGANETISGSFQVICGPGNYLYALNSKGDIKIYNQGNN